MKKKIIAALFVAGVASVSFGQGVILDNVGNTGAMGAGTSGLVYNQDGSLFDGYHYNVGVNVLYSSTQNGTYALFNTYTPTSDAKGYTGYDAGQFQLGTGFATVNIPGASAGETIWFELQFWSGSANGQGALAASYAEAITANDPTAQVIFSQVLSGGGAPPAAPTNLNNMPSVTLIATPVPEPTTLALAGLGGFGMLMAFRRKKA